MEPRMDADKRGWKNMSAEPDRPYTRAGDMFFSFAFFASLRDLSEHAKKRRRADAEF